MSSLLDPDHKQRDRHWSDYSRTAKSCFAVVLSLVILVGGGLFVFTKVGGAVSGVFSAEDYPGPGDEPVTVEVPQGATGSEIASILHENEVIASTKAFTEAQSKHDITKLQAGTYDLKTHMRAEDAIQAMLDAGVKGGKTFLIKEGLRIGEQVTELSKQTGISEDAYRAALAKPEEYSLSPWAEGNPEGFLFPDTYQMSGADPIDPLKQMAENFTAKAEQMELEQKAEQIGRSPREVVVVASIIEAEVRRPEDRPKVARVLYNRLESKPPMPLQLDTTVEYANNKPRGMGATTSDAERANPSPYNTYVHTGLPPGPIAAPGAAALEAAANPTPGDWKYFVAINLDTGETAFANTFDEHQGNVREFQQWCQAHPGRC